MKDYVTAKERVYGSISTDSADIPSTIRQKGLRITRRIGERVVINGNIIITISYHSGNQVGLCIEAPKEIIIDREEIHKKRQGGWKNGSADNS